jgi:hypothetical protein
VSDNKWQPQKVDQEEKVMSNFVSQNHWHDRKHFCKAEKEDENHYLGYPMSSNSSSSGVIYFRQSPQVEDEEQREMHYKCIPETLILTEHWFGNKIV